MAPSVIHGSIVRSGSKKSERRPRKASGLQVDCHACRDDSLACDRKKPYCSQCLERGWDKCKGYPTVLTWNNGVASRGPLRGKAIPIRESDDTSSEAIQIKSEPDSHASPSPAVAIRNGRPLPQIDTVSAHPSTSFGSMCAPAYAQVFSDPRTGQIAAMHEQWRLRERRAQSDLCSSPEFSDIQYMSPRSASVSSNITRQFEHFTFSATDGSLGSFSEGLGSPNSGWPINSLPGAFGDALSPVGSSSLSNHAFDNNTDNSYLASSMSETFANTGFGSFPQHADFQDMATLIPTSAGMDSLDCSVFEQSGVLTSPIAENTYMPFFDVPATILEDDEDIAAAAGLFTMDGRFSGPFAHLDGKLQTLLHYYDQHICPWIVAFDGAENPYRKHILFLAYSSEPLQHAIAALAENNQRMRREPAMGFIEDDLNSAIYQQQPSLASPAERFHKSQACELLNQQLKDPHAAQDDSILATILILCLFSVCDSGFTNFTNQLEGVQKILMRRSPTSQTEFTKWVQMFFIWFDVMTSAVNGREMQITGRGLNWSNLQTNMGALEEFSGCDGRLFKMIAKLGRLSLLSQGKHVSPADAAAAGSSRPSSTPHPQDRGELRRAMVKPTSSLHRSSHRPNKSRSLAMPASSKALNDFNALSSDGWGNESNLMQGLTDFYAPSNTDRRGSEGALNLGTPADRPQFWSEWLEIRDTLESWMPEVPLLSVSHVGQDAGRREMEHINESFRYAALLYTERLACPLLPSSNHYFQQHVSAGMQHIQALPVNSCVTKFLLWPLFILGTECVTEAHRELIRARCRAIHCESGFYNNLSTLDVLERVWTQSNAMPGSEAHEIIGREAEYHNSCTGSHGQALRWRKVMNRANGEYIIL